MKLAACFLTLLPGFAVAASWTSPGFPAFSEQGTGTFVSHAQLPKGTRPLTLNFDQQCWQPADAIKLNQMLSLQPCSNTPPQWRLFRDGEYTLQLDTRSGTPTLMISIQNAVEPVASLVRECPKWDGLPLTLDVSATFPEGAAVRDYYSQQIAIVKNGQITLQPAATSNGLLLLERAETDAPASSKWLISIQPSKLVPPMEVNTTRFLISQLPIFHGVNKGSNLCSISKYLPIIIYFNSAK